MEENMENMNWKCSRWCENSHVKDRIGVFNLTDKEEDRIQNSIWTHGKTNRKKVKQKTKKRTKKKD